MTEPGTRIPAWLTIDLTVIAVSADPDRHRFLDWRALTHEREEHITTTTATTTYTAKPPA